MLPGLDGMEICRQLRGQKQYTPILMLTSKSSELDRVLGLEIGADDYVVKPFSIQELIARIRAILRRAEAMGGAAADKDNCIIQHNEMRIDLDKRQVRIRNREIDLTAREFDLLVYFAKHPGKVFSRAQLLDHVWGYAYGGYEHTVNSHINRLRVKIEDDPGSPRYIMTVWGVGYRYAEG
jgi:DNA-binding response OmpR family regulator